MATQEPLSDPLRHDREVLCVAFNRDGARLVTASADYTARIWNVATGVSDVPALRHEERVNWVEFSPDGTRVVTASGDKTARLWDAKTGRALAPPLRHGSDVLMAVFSPDGAQVATASSDNTARVWDVRTGLAVSEPLRHGDEVLCVAFNPSGTRLLTGSKDGSARLWVIGRIPIPIPAHLVTLAEAAAGQRFNELHLPEPVSATTLLDLRQQVLSDAREQPEWKWYYDNRGTRTTQPDGSIAVPQFVKQRVEDSNAVALDLALLIEPTNAQAWAKMAHQASMQANRRFDAADIQWFAKYATKLAPGDAGIWETRAEACARAGLLSDARVAYERATALQGTNVMLWRGFAETLMRLNELGAARVAYDRTLALLTDDSARRKEVLLARSRIRAGLSDSPGAAEDVTWALNLPRRATNTPSDCIDLTAVYNAALGDDWQNPDIVGNNLAEFPAAAVVLDGIPWDARGVVQLQSRQSATKRFPTNVIVRVDRKLIAAHALLGAGWTDREGAEIAALVFHFADGRWETMPLRYGDEIMGWWREGERRNPPRNAKVAWSGSNDAVRGIGQAIELFHVTWRNPRPSEIVEAIEFVSRGAYAAPFLIGLTAE